MSVLGGADRMLVQKLWGREEWLVNELEYCAKYLMLRPGFQSSLHYHKVKKETFIYRMGDIEMEVGGKKEVWHYTPEGHQVTILPGTPHRFKCFSTAAWLLEVSTHHDDNDVVRLEESRKCDEP